MDEFAEMSDLLNRGGSDSGSSSSSGSDDELDLDGLLGGGASALLGEAPKKKAAAPDAEPEEPAVAETGNEHEDAAADEPEADEDQEAEHDENTVLLEIMCPPGVSPGESVEIETENGTMEVPTPANLYCLCVRARARVSPSLPASLHPCIPPSLSP